MMKKTISLLLTAVLALFVLGGCGVKQEEAQKESTGTKESADSPKQDSVTPEETNHVKINIKDYGTISVALDGTHAPVSTENFIKLAKEGFYDGLTFHRIIKDFMIQGGDPSGDGTGGSTETIKGEFSANGVENPLKHTRGAISMARSNDMDSASSQFFIVHQDSDFLDGQYAVFGYVTEGMEIVDKICEDTPVTDDNGTVQAGSEPVIESVEVVD